MTRKKHMKHTWLCMLALMLVLCMIPAHVLAASVDGSKSASPTTLNKDHNETQVSLTLPSAESKHVYDVVFVMDSSTSTVNSNIDFSINVISLLDAVAKKNATVKVGVVKVRGLAFDTIDLASDGAYKELVEYSEDTASAIRDGVNFTEKQLKALSSGTNMHGGLVMANKWLENDSEVPNENKYVIMLTDGKTYIWNDDNDVPTSIYTQYYDHYKIMPVKDPNNPGQPVLGQQTGIRDKSAYPILAPGQEVLWFKSDVPSDPNDISTYAKLYASTHEDLTGPTQYDQRCAYAYKEGTPTGTVNAHPTTNGSSLFTNTAYQKWYEFTPDAAWTGMTWLEANPYEVIDNGDGTYTFDETKPNPDYYMIHADCLQKGLYKTGHLWTDMDEKYNTAAIAYDGWGGGTGLELARSFCSWVIENSDYGAKMSETDTEEVEVMFDSIREDIIYMVASGIVTDTIPENFTLVENGTDTFTLTVNGEAVSAAADGENAWNFGKANEDGVYPYRIEFDESSNSYRWEINVPIEVSNPVTLTYTLAIDKESEAGTYPTNTSAVLDYKTSSGDTGTYEFPIPEVTFEVTEEKPDNPETGDRGKAMILGMLVVLSLAGIVTASVVIRKEGHAA